MGRRQGARRARILTGYVTDEQRSRRPVFIATLWAAASWLFFRVARSLRVDRTLARPPLAASQDLFRIDRQLNSFVG